MFYALESVVRTRVHIQRIAGYYQSIGKNTNPFHRELQLLKAIETCQHGQVYDGYLYEKKTQIKWKIYFPEFKYVATLEICPSKMEPLILQEIDTNIKIGDCLNVLFKKIKSCPEKKLNLYPYSNYGDFSARKFSIW